uniref:Uncharacterized protein n=1 Tax=Setaria viridis TaxID=4556 RepID=A0A4U6SVB7_SETVI|nr:hypothetical protein SEVIR_9G137000v2 [Setaria viridis]
MEPLEFVYVFSCLMIKKNSTCGGKTALGLFSKREDLLTQVEKTPEPLPRPYPGACNPCETTTRLATTATTPSRRAQTNHSYDLAWALTCALVMVTEPEECYWDHLTNSARGPFASCLMITLENIIWCSHSVIQL